MTKAKAEEILWVQIIEAKPNPLFTEEQRSMVRFLRYNRAIACAECGKKKRIMWTMLCMFRAKTMKSGYFTLQDSGKEHMPLTPVCGEHPLGPVWPHGIQTPSLASKNFTDESCFPGTNRPKTET